MVYITGEETNELRSGITSGFNKTLNETLSLIPNIKYWLTNRVKPVLLTAVLKGSFGTPGLVATITAVRSKLSTTSLPVVLEGAPYENGMWGVEGVTSGAGFVTVLTANPQETLYITLIGMQVYAATTTDAICKVVIGANRLVLFDKTEISADRTIYSNSQIVTPSRPCIIQPGETVKVYSASANAIATCWLVAEKVNA